MGSDTLSTVEETRLHPIPQDSGQQSPDEKTYLKKNLLVMLGVATPLILVVMSLIPALFIPRGPSPDEIWDYSLVTDIGSSTGGGTQYKVEDPSTLESGALAEHLEEAVPKLGGRRKFLAQESTDQSVLLLGETASLHIVSREGQPITLSAESWQALIDRALDERMEFVEIQAGYGEYVGVRINYWLVDDKKNNPQEYMSGMEYWKLLPEASEERVVYTHVTGSILNSDSYRINSTFSLGEIETWLGYIASAQEISARHLEGVEGINLSRDRFSGAYTFYLSFSHYKGDEEAARQALVEELKALGLEQGYELSLWNQEEAARYAEGQWTIEKREVTGSPSP